MKISEKWLREWVPTTAALDTVADRLTMAGLEVDAILDAGPALDGVVVGRIERCDPHAQADRLQVCRVDIGAAAPLNIVCGAPNARAGLVVPVAIVGSTLPSGVVIEQTTIRGEPSAGMLCSASELGLASDSSGLWELGDDAAVGQPVSACLELPDTVLDIDLTPNRGDCLSLRGVARELSVMLDTPLTIPDVVAPEATIDTARHVAIEAPRACVGYAARCVHGNRAGAATPIWMAERLRRAGIRRISLPVDIGNYVMLELGQPMHAFDADRLQGTIRVRYATAGERIVTLDDEDVALADDTLVIADDAGPVAIAGMIGGQRTAVDDTTRNVVFEAACFTPGTVAGQGRRYKIHTDSLHRFERGVDPALHPVALDRAVGLLMTHGGGQSGPAYIEAGEPIHTRSPRIALSAAHVERLLGEPIEAAWIEAALGALGITLTASETGHWIATPPSWRFDIEIEADLIEEVARVHGYDRLAGHSQGVSLPPVPTDGGRDPMASADSVLRQRGYSEAISYSFVERALHRALTGDAAVVPLDNPISDQMTEMRRTLWASLLPCWAHNVRRQQGAVRLYERGLRFLPQPNAEHGIEQRETVAGLIGGVADDTHWDRASRPVDFFDIKGDVEALYTGVTGSLRFEPAPHPALHPGRSARIMLDGTNVGWLGQLAPSFSSFYKNSALPYLFEIDSRSIAIDTAARFEPLSEQPLVRRDLAVVTSEHTPVADLVDAIHSVDSAALRSVEVFDLFRGEGLETGFKSVALGLIFQDKASTLTDERVGRIINRVVAALEQRCGARIRGE